MRNMQLKIVLVFVCFQSSAYAQEDMPNSSANVDGMWGFKAPVHYEILPRPANHSNKGQPNTYAAPLRKIESTPTQQYAYGWFGAKPSPHWYRQFGHQKAYTQWTLR